MTRARFKAHYNKGIKLSQRRKFSEAINEFEAALTVKPGDVDTIFQLGNMSKAMHLYDVAIKWYDVALNMQPASVEIAFNRAEALRLDGRNQDALNAYTLLTPLMENNPILWNNIGTLYQQMSMTKNAIEALERAISLKPNYFEAWNNLGLSYFVVRNSPTFAGKWITAFNKAERLYAKDPSFHINRATCHFGVGNYKEGWADYSYRHDSRHEKSVLYKHKIPWWKGETLTNKTILIGEEQGIGDQIVFSSILNEIAAKANRVILEVNPKLVPILSRNFPDIHVKASHAETISMKRHHTYEWLNEKVDYFAPFGDVFYYMRPTLDDFPMRKSFISSNPLLQKNWKKRLDKLSNKPKVGISWRSSKMTGARQDAYFQLNELLPWIETMKSFQFINIQYGDCESELSANKKRSDGTWLIESFDDLDLFDDIEGTCAFIDSLDFILSVRNTQASFAGALGKKVISIRGSHFQFGHKHIDPVYPTVLSVFPRHPAPPMIQQYQEALQDFKGTYTRYARNSDEYETLIRNNHFYLQPSP